MKLEEVGKWPLERGNLAIPRGGTGGRGQALHSPHFNPDEAALPYGLTAASGLLACLAEPQFPLLAPAGPVPQEEDLGVM